MKKTLITNLLILAALLLAENVEAQPHSLVGTWQGKLAVSGVELRIIFHIEANEDGLSGTLDSPDQNAYGIACGDVSLVGESVTIVVPQIGGTYQGEFSDQKNIEGTWSQGPANLPLNLSFTEEVEELKRPQEPKPPFPYKSEEVSIENASSGVTLSGTLTIPAGAGPFPGAVLVTGSGPQDRDEAIMGHKPFLVIADYLTRNGIAVLRYDDRGFGGSTGDFQSATSEDFAEDAKSAVDYLRMQAMINPLKIGIIGHSEGGMIAPMVAVQEQDIGFIVLLAGTGLTGADIILLQSRLIAAASGVSEEDIERNSKFNKGAIQLVTTIKDSDELDQKAEAFIDDFAKLLPESQQGNDSNIKRTLRSQINQYNSPGFKYFLTYDPVPTLEKVKCPVLALNGEFDLQVPPKENLDAIEAALKRGNNKNYRVEELPGLNHLFQHTETGSPAEYSQIEETFSEDVLKMMTDWIRGL